MKTKCIVGVGVVVIFAISLAAYHLYPGAMPINVEAATSTEISMPKALTNKELLALADNKYADGNVPLSDNNYITTGAKKGYVYLCNAHQDNPGSAVNGPWIQGKKWNFLKKVSISGSIKWAQAVFKNSVAKTTRTLTGNGLPTTHTTGVFPVATTDAAHQYDANPNTISAQTLQKDLPLNPTYSKTPYCMGGEVGIMLTGVPLFNAFDAGLRDAPAHELQDSCDGHPQGSGEYHYHSLSACFKNIGVSTVLGYALDGFPITGPMVAKDKYLTTEDLDECHGIVSEVVIDGKKKNTYHYVMTRDFPYSAGCFRGKPVSLMVIQNGGGKPTQSGNSAQPTGMGNAQPPAAATSVCSGKTRGTHCTFATPQGSVNGHCDEPPNMQSLVCVPAR